MIDPKSWDGHTPSPWFAATQNDMLYVIAGRSPSLNNDSPFHEADRTPLARVYDDEIGMSTAMANSALIAAAPELEAEVERLCNMGYSR